jgi:hypothetical protein
MLLRGLIDSGADYSCVPYEYAALLGYSDADMRQEQGGQVQGQVMFWRAPAPLMAMLPGDPEHSFELHPNFVENSDMTLWGPMDFFRAWHVILTEASQQFSLMKIG